MCSPGRYGSSVGLNSSDCSGLCERGFYCLQNSTTASFLPCPFGTFCPAGCGAPIPVPPGSYATKDAGDIVPCEAGQWCAQGVKAPCLGGYWGGSPGASIPTCSGTCGGGFYCPPGSITYMTFACPLAGALYCPPGSVIPVAVQPGYYRSEDRASVSPCPTGSFCINATTFACPGGTFGATLGLTSPACSGNATAGYYTLSGATFATQYRCSGANMWCPPGSSAPVMPPPGFTPALSYAFLVECVPGSFCVNGSISLCPGGRFGATQRLSSAVCSGQCRQGYYCAPGSVSAEQEPCSGVGFFCGPACAAPERAAPGRYAAPAKDMSIECPRAFYCSDGTKEPCPVGVYGATTGLSRAICSGQCSAGYFCPPGSVQANQTKCAQPGTFCPLGALSVSLAPNGTMPNADQSGVVDCPIRFWCTGGIAALCPAGRFGNIPQLFTRGCAGACTPGYYCPTGSSSSTQVACVNTLAMYCPQGSGEPHNVPTGMFADSQRANVYDCPIGSYCLDGVVALCPGGSFGAESRISNSSCSGLCEPGYYCTPGSVSRRQFKCGSGNAFCGAGSASPEAISAGYYGVGVSKILQSGQQHCDPGHYCLFGNMFPCAAGRFGGTSGLSVPDCSGLVPPGTYSPEASSIPSSCGHNFTRYCPGATGAPVPISVGYYASQPVYLGGNTSIVTAYAAQTMCPPGSFCAFGQLPVECPAGRYGSSPSLNTATCTGPCDAGYFCASGAATGTQNPCGAIHLACAAGSAQPTSVAAGYFTTPVDGSPALRTGYELCPAGNWCLRGLQTPCAAGMVGSSAGLNSSRCDGPCAAGFYCGIGTHIPQACGESAFYCPAGVTMPLIAPPGYASSGGGTDGSSRTRIDPCGGAQFYCSRGVRRQIITAVAYYTVPENVNDSIRSGALVCPAGSYCVDGVRQLCDVAGACPPGSFSEVSGPCSPPNVVCVESNGVWSTVEIRDGYQKASNASIQECGGAEYYCVGGIRYDVGIGNYSKPDAAPPGIRTGESACGSAASYCKSGMRRIVPPGYFSIGPAYAAFDVARCGNASVYCINGVMHGTPRGSYTIDATYGDSAEAATRSVAKVCEAGYWCSVGVRYSCWGGTYSTASGASSSETCRLCPAGSAGNRALQIFDSPRACVPCSSGWSLPGAVKCWPMPVSVIAEDSGGRPGVSIGDTITIAFNEPVFEVPVSTNASLQALVAFSATFAEEVRGSWLSSTQLLVSIIRLAVNVDLAATRVGLLKMYVLETGDLRDAGRLSNVTRTRGSDPAWNFPVVVSGSWGAFAAPVLLSAVAVPAAWHDPATAARTAGVSAGDTLTLTFDIAVTPIPSTTSTAVRAAFAFSAAFADFDFAGSWASPTSLVITLQSVRMGTEGSPSYEADKTTWIKSGPSPLTITVLAEANVLSLDLSSLPSRTTVLVTGTWGDRCSSFNIALASSSSLFVRAQDTAANGALPAVAFVIHVSTTANFVGFVANFSVQPAVAAQGVFISSLPTGVPLWARVALSQSISLPHDAASTERFTSALFGPPLYASSNPVVLNVPHVSAVSAGTGMITAGGEHVMLRGSNFGIIAIGRSLVVHYCRHNGTSREECVPITGTQYVATSCQVLPPVGTAEQVGCLTAAGVGFDLRWRVTLDGESGDWTTSATGISAYQAPTISTIITREHEEEVASANTVGGSVLVITGAQFGSVAENAVDAVIYHPSLFASIQFSGLMCRVTQDHVEIQCLLSPGAGLDLTFVVIIAGQVSVLPSIRYHVPVVRAVSALPIGAPIPPATSALNFETNAVMKTLGGSTIVIDGENFGDRFQPIVMYSSTTTNLLLTAVNCSIVIPHKRIACISVAGIGAEFDWFVTILGQRSSAGASGRDSIRAACAAGAITSYAPPSITSYEPTTGSTAGGYKCVCKASVGKQ